MPGFADSLAPSVVQLHSSAYRNPAQLQQGPVLVVGLGNSGAEIALDVSSTHPTWVAGRPCAAMPGTWPGTSPPPRPAHPGRDISWPIG